MSDEQKENIVRIEWIDSYGCSASWTAANDIELDICLCVSVGFVAKEDDESIAVMPHAASLPNGDRQGMGELVIPKCAIKRIELLVPSRE